MSKKKVERVTVECVSETYSITVTRYRCKSCGEVYELVDDYPPTYCPYCGRMIDYAGPEGEGEQ